MYSVQICIQCLGRFSEILLDDKAKAEEHFKDLVKNILLEFFIMAIIDHVSIYYFPDAMEGVELFSLQVAARCADVKFPNFIQELASMELALENRISCALLEFVGRVDVENVSIRNLPPEKERILSRSS